MLLTVYLLVVSVSQNGCYPQFLGVDVSPHKVVAWGWVDHGLQLTANTVRLRMAKVSINDNDITKTISRVPIYHTKWKCRALYNSINNTHSLTHTRTCTCTHTLTHPHTHMHTHTHSPTHAHTHSLTHTRTCTHTLTHPHTQTHQLGDRHGCEKDSLETVSESLNRRVLRVALKQKEWERQSVWGKLFQTDRPACN